MRTTRVPRDGGSSSSLRLAPRPRGGAGVRAARRALGAATAVIAWSVAAPALDAQPVTLTPKPSLSLPAVGACVRQPPPAPGARRDEAAGRAAAARGRELALVGDRAGARTEFARAATLDPAAPSHAYDVGRSAEELGDRAGAISAYCRYLALAPAGAESGEVRTRLQRLDASGDPSAERRSREAFAQGVGALREQRWVSAAASFDAVLRLTPNAPEAAYNRGLARLGLGRDADAARDLAAYVASPVAGADRADVLRAIDGLQKPTWSPPGAFLRGIVVPGLGQMYTGRAVAGVVVLAATAGAVAYGLKEETVVTEQQFTDPFGNPYTAETTSTDRPNLAAGLATAAALVTAAAIEASFYAARSGRARPVVSVRPSNAARGSWRGAPATVVNLGVAMRF